jgi:hypothetical protein
VGPLNRSYYSLDYPWNGAANCRCARGPMSASSDFWVTMQLCVGLSRGDGWGPRGISGLDLALQEETGENDHGDPHDHFRPEEPEVVVIRPDRRRARQRISNRRECEEERGEKAQHTWPDVVPRKCLLVQRT